MIITELMKTSLFDVLHIQKIKLKFSTKLSIIESIAHGMNHLHECKVLHCDLKTKNILVGDDHKVKLCDFGMSKIKNKL